ncbi:MAG: quinone oxidoreductase [Elusimicrobia bacterium GWC2_64_44]|nr:MAG: quinone oxidoreductase [Elusimicrobia bacterium GWC2_64_44]
MKAIRVSRFGGPEELRLEEAPVPAPAAGQVLVRVLAAGVNPYEAYIRSGAYPALPALPYTPGSDGAGTVAAIGPEVTAVKPGDRVYIAKCLSGTYAEYALALEGQVHPLPDRVTFQQGAALWVPCGAAYHALTHQGGAAAGETVLVHGASGAVGGAAVQFARARGLTVLGTAGTPKGRELALRLGAHAVFDHTAPGYLKEIEAACPRGADLVLEMLANVNLGADLKLLAKGGRVVVIGSRGESVIDPRDLMSRRGSIRAFTLWSVTPQEEREIHGAIAAGLADGTLNPAIGREFPLAEAAAAHAALMAPGAAGKIVLIP